jgi:mannose-1-phosphate guanylyltransferase
MVTKAAVLCGGEGTRLRPLTNFFQKTMIPIGPKRKPLLEYIVRLMAHNGVAEVVLLTGYRAEEIEKYFDEGVGFGVKISYSKDPPDIKGSAQSLAVAIEGGKLREFDELVVYYGDVLSTLNVRELVARHRAERAALTLVLTRDYRVPVGVAHVDGGRVTAFSEKPTIPLNATTGCLVLSRETLPVLKEATEGGGTDIMTHFVPRVIERGMKVTPFFLDGFWQDIGTIEAYEKLDPRVFEENLKFLE